MPPAPRRGGAGADRERTRWRIHAGRAWALLRSATMTTQAPPPGAPAQEYSDSIPGAPLSAVLYDNELARRPARVPDRARLSRAVVLFLRGIRSSPDTVLQSLTDTILEALQCDSAGISLINDERTRFYWPAISGVWRPHTDGGTPLGFGPCGDVLRMGGPLHMREIHKRYTYFTPVAWVREVLLVPFTHNKIVTGTIWAVLHQPPNDERSKTREPRLFDREDLAMLEDLGGLATSAYEVWLRAPARADAAGPQCGTTPAVPSP